MLENQALILASIGVVSLVCQWLAWRVRVPAILFLLVAGIVMGPGLAWLDPNAMFGDLLFPIVSLAVAVILFEGSLTLKFSEMREHGKMVRNLLVSGTLVTWLVGTLASAWALDLSWAVAAVFGAIVVVTGPTVVMPLLRAIRPNARISNILKWEGIVIDPIGALLAVLVFEFAISSQGSGLEQALLTFGSSVVLSTLLGCIAAYVLGLALRSHWLPQFLQNAGSLTFMLGIFAFSNYLEHESGLLTITIMGIWLANMKGVPVDDLLEFKESLSVLLISALFIILAARIDVVAVVSLGWGAVWVLLALIFIARPASVWLAALGTVLSWQEKSFLSWIAPRGIVAAAVSALFAFKLEANGYSDAAALVPLVFLVIVVTVILQSLTAAPLAHLLKVTESARNGFLFIGANPVARELAKALASRDIPVVLTDTSWEHVRAARMDNLRVYYGNPVSEHAENNLDLSGIGNMLAISPYRQLNTLATYHYLDLMDEGHVFGLPEGEQGGLSSHQSATKYLRTREPFDEATTFAKLASQLSQGAQFKVTQLSAEFSYEDYLAQHANRMTVVLARKPNGQVRPLAAERGSKPEAGWEVFSLIQPEQPELD